MDNTDFYLRFGTLFVAHIAVFGLALCVFFKRKESGFLFLAVAFGVQLLLELNGLLAMAGFGGSVQQLRGIFSLVVIYGPPILMLIGLALLLKGKKAKA